jgi:hypothetical protein
MESHPAPKSSGSETRARHTAGGVDFRMLTAGWLVLGMLAETEFEPPWGMAARRNGESGGRRRARPSTIFGCGPVPMPAPTS